MNVINKSSFRSESFVVRIRQLRGREIKFTKWSISRVPTQILTRMPCLDLTHTLRPIDERRTTSGRPSRIQTKGIRWLDYVTKNSKDKLDYAVWKHDKNTT